MRPPVAHLSSAALCTALALTNIQCNWDALVTTTTVEQVSTVNLQVRFDVTEGNDQFADTVSVDVDDVLRLREEIEDAGGDPEDLVSLSISGALYRVTRPDPCGCRRIENGRITVGRDGQDPAPLVADFEANVSFITDPTPIPLRSEGVALLNEMLADLITALQTGVSSGETYTYVASGLSVPGCTTCDFEWELTVIVGMVLAIEVDLPNVLVRG